MDFITCQNGQKTRFAKKGGGDGGATTAEEVVLIFPIKSRPKNVRTDDLVNSERISKVQLPFQTWRIFSRTPCMLE